MSFYSMTGVRSDELQCIVCLEIYKEPITLPCGHSFCRVCIEKYWESKKAVKAWDCPNCREVFTIKPKLKKSIILASLVEQMKLTKRAVESGVDVPDAEPCGATFKKGVNSGDVEHHCEVCNKKAAKRCVPCEILCCEIHVKPHQEKGHKLVKPGVKLEELRCTKHGKPLLLYCKDDESLMCVMCTAGQHKDHEVVAVEIVHDELKGFLTAKCPELSKSKQHLESQLHQLQQEVEKTQHSGRGTVGKMEEKRTELYQFVDKSVNLMKSQVIKRQNEKIFLLQKQMYEVKEQLNSLHEANSTLKTVLQDVETISFLQGYKNLIKRLESMSHFQSPKMAQPTVLDFSEEETNMESLIQLHENFLKNIMKPVELKTSELDQNSLRSLYGRTPSLEPNSAHPVIVISQDLRTATRTGTEQPYPDHPDRFDLYPQVVSSESFSSGRHYWEVDVSSSRWWRIGICLNSMGRKGRESGLGQNPESWCLVKYKNKLIIMHNSQETLLSVPGDPERVGFLLDYEAGELRCFGDSGVLHVFRGNFMDPVKPAIGFYYYVDDSVRFCSL